MQLESLKVFCDVARHRSITRAAALNQITQSAASQLVSQLEKRLGVQLVNRSKRPLHLTALGRKYYDGCKTLVEQYWDLETSMREAQAEMAARVEVAAIYSVGLGDMGQCVDQFHSQNPNTQVHVEYLHPNRVYERVSEGTADFGLVSYPRPSREFTVISWRDEEMVLACAPAHRLAEQRTVKPGQLEGEKYIGFDKGLMIRQHVDRFLREQGVVVEMALEFDNIENIKQAVEISAGVALLPAPTLRREINSGTLAARPLKGHRLVRPIGIIHRRHHKLSTNALLFMELIRQREAAPTNGDGDDAGNSVAGHDKTLLKKPAAAGFKR